MDLRERFGPLLNFTIVVVSVSYGLVHALAALLSMAGIAASILALLLRIVVWLSVWRYAYAVLRGIAQGHRELPAPGPESLNPLGELALTVHFFLFPALAYFVVASGYVPGFVQLPIVAALAAVFPASAALMAVTGNFAIALSPVHVAGLIARLGGSYGRLLGASALLTLSVLAVHSVPWPLLPGAAVTGTFDTWLCLGLFALTGAMLREHRLELGIPGEVEPAAERDARRRREDWQQSLDRAYVSIRSGLLDQGYREIRELVESEGGSLEIHAWVFDTMSRWRLDEHATRFGATFVGRLLEAGETHAALELYTQCRRRSADFHVPSAEIRTLAEYARSIGRHGLADEISAA